MDIDYNINYNSMDTTDSENDCESIDIGPNLNNISIDDYEYFMGTIDFNNTNIDNNQQNNNIFSDITDTIHIKSNIESAAKDINLSAIEIDNFEDIFNSIRTQQNDITATQENPSNIETNNLKDFIEGGYNIDKSQQNIKEFEDDEDAGTNNVVILGSVTTDVSQTDENVNKKKKRKRELESLGISEYKDQNDEFDVYVDDKDKIYKKYRLRDKTKKPENPVPKPTPSGEEKSIQCTLCNQKVLNTTELRKHQKYKHNLNFTCSLCNEKFESNTHLVTHKVIHDSEHHSLICHKCKLAFSNQYDYLTHKITHSSLNVKHKCPECGHSFKKSYAKHLATHFNLNLTSPSCLKKVQGKVESKKHVKARNKKKLYCVECGVEMKDKNKYDVHLSIHTGVKINQCFYCGKGFRTVSQRTIHMRIHGNDR